MLIDAHVHFWRIGRNGQTWPTPDLTTIHADFLPDDLWRPGEPLGLTGAVAVQSQPDDRDTDWLLDLAEADDRILGVIGWVDLAAPDAVDRIARLASHRKLKGLRPMLQDLERDDWIIDPGLTPALEAMAQHRLCMDALVRPRHLEPLAELARRHPDLPLVIDHAAKPEIASRAFDDWSNDLARLAVLPQVVCKLSGLLTETAPAQPASAIAPYAARVFELFGPDRVMWGSDWPVLTLAADYETWLTQARNLCPPGAVASVFGTLARRVYRLEGGA